MGEDFREGSAPGSMIGVHCRKLGSLACKFPGVVISTDPCLLLHNHYHPLWRANPIPGEEGCSKLGKNNDGSPINDGWLTFWGRNKGKLNAANSAIGVPTSEVSNSWSSKIEPTSRKNKMTIYPSRPGHAHGCGHWRAASQKRRSSGDPCGGRTPGRRTPTASPGRSLRIWLVVRPDLPPYLTPPQVGSCHLTTSV